MEITYLVEVAERRRPCRLMFLCNQNILQKNVSGPLKIQVPTIEKAGLQPLREQETEQAPQEHHTKRTPAVTVSVSLKEYHRTKDCWPQASNT